MNKARRVFKTRRALPKRLNWQILSWKRFIEEIKGLKNYEDFPDVYYLTKL